MSNQNRFAALSPSGQNPKNGKKKNKNQEDGDEPLLGGK